jgi:hypothetical protein
VQQFELKLAVNPLARAKGRLAQRLIANQCTRAECNVAQRTKFETFGMLDAFATAGATAFDIFHHRH